MSNTNDFSKGKEYVDKVRNNLKKASKNMALQLPGTAIAIVDRDKKQILLKHRTDDNTIGMLGGGMGIYETFEQCAVREVFEESGIIIQKKYLKLWEVFKGPEFVTVYPNDDVVMHITFAAIVDYKDCIGHITMLNSEIKELIWVDYDKVLTLDLFGANRPMLEVMIEKLQNEN